MAYADQEIEKVLERSKKLCAQYLQLSAAAQQLRDNLESLNGPRCPVCGARRLQAIHRANFGTGEKDEQDVLAYRCAAAHFWTI